MDYTEALYISYYSNLLTKYNQKIINLQYQFKIHELGKIRNIKFIAKFL